MDKTTIRRATAEDKEIVLRINNNVYEGRDYLPAFYDYFLSSPVMLPVVMLSENQIIAYVVGQIIDNGEAIVNRAGRISPQFEARGLITYINQYLYDWGLSKGVKSMVFTTSDSNPSLNKPEFRKLTRYIMTRQFPIYYLAGQGLIFTEKDRSEASMLKTVSDIHLSLYFKSKVIRDYLSPRGRLLVDAVPYKMIDANIPFILQPENYTEIYSDLKARGCGCSGLLSFGLVYPIPRPQFKYVLNIFGSDTSTLRTHIVKHLLRLKDRTKEVTALVVFVSESFDLDKVDKVFEDFGISRRPHKSAYPELKSNQIYAYETVGQKLTSNL